MKPPAKSTEWMAASKTAQRRGRILESQSRIIETVDIERRAQKLEENMATAPVSGPKITGFPDQAQQLRCG
jgi:hypothetical protein